MKPFGFQFFMILLLKAFLFISTKGGMFLKLHNKLLIWLHDLLRVGRGSVLILHMSTQSLVHINPGQWLRQTKARASTYMYMLVAGLGLRLICHTTQLHQTPRYP